METRCAGAGEPGGPVVQAIRQVGGGADDDTVVIAVNSNPRSLDPRFATRLLRIENSILLIQEQALTRSDPSFIEAEVKAATAGLDTSEEVLRMMELPALDSALGGPPPALQCGDGGALARRSPPARAPSWRPV